MSEVSNIAAIDLSKPQSEKTFFNNFFTVPISFSSNQHDALLSFFEITTQNPKAAVVLTSAVIYTGKQQGIDPMQILEEFKKLSKDELSRTLALFLNYYRYGSSLLGVNVVNQNNQYILRSVLY